MPEDHRTTITIPADLLVLVDKLRSLRLLPRDEGLRKDNAAVIWLAMREARRMLGEAAAPPKRKR